ncbi:MAG: inorganic phosphate transporter [Chthonomonadaceae bacterium]|nr:inorganic phosphate transporter [Chthonomonadaceae bacterium]
MLALFDGAIGGLPLFLLFVCLAIALGFEFVNGFHDTANAVATVIYTKSLKPHHAVVWSGLVNLVGVLLSGGAVAFSIVHLLPMDILVNIGSTAGMLMVACLLIAALVWNLSTWYFGLPASSSHALIGSIVGVGMAASAFGGQGVAAGVNWDKLKEIALALVVSPLIGFAFAGLLLLILKVTIKDPKLYSEPQGDAPPPFFIRLLLIGTCTGVSFSHGSNDGQKGIGLVMLILIGMVPLQFAVNPKFDGTDVHETLSSIRNVREVIRMNPEPKLAPKIEENLAKIESRIGNLNSLDTLSQPEKAELRRTVMASDVLLNKYSKAVKLDKPYAESLKSSRKKLMSIVDFVVGWVIYAVALALGLGTMFGWKRIVVTVGEKIGKTHLTYAQGAAAELVAFATIMSADKIGVPVSTTHILSSGIAGTMAANRSGLQFKTIRNIALAWVLTVPVTILLAAALYFAAVSIVVKPEARTFAPLVQTK